MRLHYRDFMSLASIAMVVLVAAITSRSASDTCLCGCVGSCSGGCDSVRMGVECVGKWFVWTVAYSVVVYWIEMGARGALIGNELNNVLI